MLSKSALLMLSSALSACLSMTLFRHVLHGRIRWRGEISVLIRDTFSLFAEPLFLFGVLAFVTANILWLVVLATQKLSVAYPVQIGLVTLFTAIVSILVFRENVSIRLASGYIMLLMGVLLIFE